MTKIIITYNNKSNPGYMSGRKITDSFTGQSFKINKDIIMALKHGQSPFIGKNIIARIENK
jgi:hypothetical protein